MNSKVKAILIQLRNRLYPSNSFKISRKANFTSEVNMLNTQIRVAPNNTVHFKEGVIFRNLTITIKGEGNELIIHENAYLVGDIQLHGNNNRVEIGQWSRLVGTTLIAHKGTRITIGEHCMFANDTNIRTTDSHPIYNSEGDHINPDKDVVIHDRVWLARSVWVLKGAEIESDTVIGTRSLVTGFIPKNTVAGGSPAKVLKTGITWRRKYKDEI